MRTKKSKVTPKNRTFVSLAQAAGALGCDIESLKAAKRMGCGAFRNGGRIYEKELLAWTSQNSPQLFSEMGTLSLRDQKVAQEIRKLRLRNDLEEGKLVKRCDVAATIQKIFGAMMPRLEQKLVTEYPSAICVDVIQGRVYGKRLYDQVAEAFREFESAWK